ncbi:unnamed protein product [Arabidopsis thaliana]|uniref:(thale cress) hypothetical protein n=1 Tax=Arabidopsis thaliana TaxID=3702 RepID=A0A7G2FC43_ARATH|nr:unnamed protein product [Arabidopsis thaliana]
MHVDSMKRARVSAVYEGKERNRSSNGEETRREQSKHARMTAKARMNVYKESMKSLPPKRKKSLMIISLMRKKEDTQDDQNIVTVVEKEKEEKEKGTVQNIRENAKMLSSKCVEEWPHMLTYEEEWTWFAFAFGWGWWQRYDAVMSGKGWFN